MTSRSAEATIKGYYYQFDTTILRLLELKNPSDVIAIEGIEDIDIHTATESTAVQCKYLSKQNFTNSSVREPITLMLDHFVLNQSSPINYVLYAHFEKEHGGAVKIISLKDLKEILTYSEKKVQKSHHIDNGISDTVLKSFLKKFKMVFGVKFEDQQSSVILKLKTYFSCSDFEADAFYYNNGLRNVIDISILKDANKRKLSKAQFLTAIDTAKQLYNEWYIRLKSKAEFLKQISHSIKATKANVASKSRHIIISEEILNANNSELNFIGMVENLVHTYYRMGHALRDAKPPTLILDVDQQHLTEIKKQLIGSNLVFNDGYEHLFFSADFFDRPPIINVTTSKAKLSKSSYQFRLISLATLLEHFSRITEPKVVMNFSKKESPYEKSTTYSLFDIKHCETLKDISTLI